MALVDEAAALQTRHGLPCFRERLLVSNPTLAAELDDALASDVDAEAIARALRARGLEVEGDTIRDHRNGKCRRCRS